MVKFQSTKVIPIMLALIIALLVTACSPQTPPPTSPPAPTPPGEDTVPHLDDLVLAMTSGATEDLLGLVYLSSLPCTKGEGLGGPPKCIADETEGTLVDVLPILGSEGHHIRHSDLSNWAGLGEAQLYAAFRTSESTYSDEFFPAGEFGVVFLLPDQTNGVIFQVTEDGIVRIDLHDLSSIEDILKKSEVVLGPIPLTE